MYNATGHRFWSCLVVIGFLVLAAKSVSAQIYNQERHIPSDKGNQKELVTYSAEFFRRYQPNTALDMVQQVPGFQLDDGSNLRGFSSAAGNILINNRRPSTKQDALSAILTRIPASYVERIDLIRGQLSGVDLQGQSVIANIIMHDDVSAAIRWQVKLRRNFNNSHNVVGRETSVSLSDHWMGIDYNAGLSLKINPRSYIGPENVYDEKGNLREKRNDDYYRDSKNGEVNLNASTNFSENLIRLNTKLAYVDQDGLLTSAREPWNAGSEGTIPLEWLRLMTFEARHRNELFGQDQTSIGFELGVDVERSLSQYLSGKVIFLLYTKDDNSIIDQHVIDVASDEILFLREADTKSDTSEAISRLEFDWVGWDEHMIQGNFELAYNVVEGSLVQTEDRGTGSTFVIVPGANTKVEETRWDILLQDSWSPGKLVINYGLSMERSTISAKGDDEQKRSFFYLKPQGQLTYSFNFGQQIRFRVAREVAQLDFNDFISTSVFEDDDLALGNTKLIPEITWVNEISYEKRFSELGVVTLTAFHHWLSDVQDLLPLTPKFEVPGNIGDGKRWGVELETTIPLGWMQMIGARLDVKARWQSSLVTDPVTHEIRTLSGKTGFGSMTAIPFRDDSDEFEYVFDIAYRQDFNNAKVAWGWDIAERAERTLFKINELDIVDEGEFEFNAFIETTRWGNIKVRLEAQNILNLAEERNRTIFIGARNSSFIDVEHREMRARNKGFRLFLVLGGNF